MKIITMSILFALTGCSWMHTPTLVHNACQLDGTPSRPYWEVELKWMRCPDGRMVQYEVEINYNTKGK